MLWIFGILVYGYILLAKAYQWWMKTIMNKHVSSMELQQRILRDMFSTISIAIRTHVQPSLEAAPKERILAVSNHVNFYDTLILIHWFTTHFPHHSLHFVVGECATTLWLIGDHLKTHHIFTHDIKGKSEQEIHDYMSYCFEHRFPAKCIVILFPEGKLLLPSPSPSLLNPPRAKGYHIMKQHVDALYDITLCYPPSTLQNFHGQWALPFLFRDPFPAYCDIFIRIHDDFPPSIDHIWGTKLALLTAMSNSSSTPALAQTSSAKED